MSAVVAEKTCSPDDYLALERIAEFKSEFVQGKIQAMTGASREHNLVAMNIAGILRPQLKHRPCEAYLSDMRVKTGKANSYRYPDIAVVCGQPEFEDSHVDTLLNPTLLIEILSPSTEASDRGDKFAEYRRIPSLQEYLLAAQDRPYMERYVRQGENWLLTESKGVEVTVSLDAIGCELALREVYDKVLAAPGLEQWPGVY